LKALIRKTLAHQVVSEHLKQVQSNQLKELSAESWK
jgi:hypothetical protein